MYSSGQVNVQEWNTPPGRHLALQDAICGGEHSLKLTGELDVGSAPDLEAAIARACASSAHAITLDLRELTFIDSTGLAAIISASSRCRESEFEFRLVPGPAPVQRVFELTGLLTELPFEQAATA